MASTSDDIIDDLADQFCAITGAAKEAAIPLLEACNRDLQLAIGMHMDGSAAQAGATDPELGESSSMGQADGTDAVRAPIPQTREQLVDEQQQQYYGPVRRRKPRSVFDGFRDFQAETEQAEERLRTGRVGGRKKRTLEDLFRPPVELMHKGSFVSAKQAGTDANKWLLVNIQNVQEFPCQVLNRDVWSNAAVKDVVNFHFIFWQVYSDSEEGKKFMQFYKINKWPYVAVIDPITGESIVEWEKIDAPTLIELVNTFVAERPRPDSSSESPPQKRAKLEESILEASEDSQIEAAIKASMRENRTITLSSDESNQDSDDLETFTDSDSDTETPKVEKKPPRKSPTCKVKNSKKVLPDLTSSESELNSDNEDKNHRKYISTSKGKSLVKSRTPVKNGRCKTRKEIDVVGLDSNTDSLPSTGNSDSCPPNTLDISPNTADISPNTTNTADISSQESLSSSTSWRDHLGCETDDKTKLLLRFPDGKREPLTIPCTSKLQCVTQYVSENQVDLKEHELVTNFPRRNISSMDLHQTLQQAGLHPQETIFIQEKS